MAPEVAVAGVLFAALLLYAVTGGADFGAGVWDLLAYGPRKKAQRRVIARAIGPIWEANHVWLILVIVVMFVCFPRAYALIGTALHWPLTLMLVGIVLRGTSFVFRTYSSRDDNVQARWSLVFSISSAVTPVFLGINVGAVASGALTVDAEGHYNGGFFALWFAPFPLSVGLFTLALFSLLAAVYLANDAEDPALKDDFRRYALAASAMVFLTAWSTFLFAGEGAPVIRAGLVEDGFAFGMHALIAGMGLALVGCLIRGKLRVARGLAVIQVALLIAGWGAAQYPWILVNTISLHDAAAPDNVLWGTLGVLGVGAVPLLATYIWMIRVFRRARLSGEPSPEAIEANPGSEIIR